MKVEGLSADYSSKGDKFGGSKAKIEEWEESVGSIGGVGWVEINIC